jgi:MFS family permease
VSDQTVAAAAVAPPATAAAPSSRRWWILGVVGLAQLMVVLDATIVTIALPSAQRDLAFSNADRQWVVTAYSLAFGGLLLLGGRLSDLVGRRRMLLIGLIGFAAASAVGGAATSFAILVIARGAQGAFTVLVAFVLVERRVQHPLLPLRIAVNRFRGGAYLAIGLSAIGIFGIFLFLTYYLQETLGYSPVTSGLAFLPMIAAIVVASTVCSGSLMPRFGPRPLIPVGLVFAADGLVFLATQLSLHTSSVRFLADEVGHKP